MNLEYPQTNTMYLRNCRLASCSVDGRLLTFDGKDFYRLWEVKRPNTKSYTSLAVGFFTPDTIPNFFLSFA